MQHFFILTLGYYSDEHQHYKTLSMTNKYK